MPEDPTAARPLSQEIRCGILSNAAGKVMFLHEGPISTPLWAELDTQAGEIAFVYDDGTSRALGLHLDRDMIGNLRCGEELLLARMQNGKFVEFQRSPLHTLL